VLGAVNRYFPRTVLTLPSVSRNHTSITVPGFTKCIRSEQDFLRLLVEKNSNISFQHEKITITPRAAVPLSDIPVVPIKKKLPPEYTHLIDYGMTGTTTEKLSYLYPKVFTTEDFKRTKVTLSTFSAQLGKGLYTAENYPFEISLYFGLQNDVRDKSENAGVSLVRIFSPNKLKVLEIPEIDNDGTKLWWNGDALRKKELDYDAFSSEIADFSNSWRQYKFNERSYPQLKALEDIRIIKDSPAHKMGLNYLFALAERFSDITGSN
jgi:hypothetical protein